MPFYKIWGFLPSVKIGCLCLLGITNSQNLRPSLAIQRCHKNAYNSGGFQGSPAGNSSHLDSEPVLGWLSYSLVGIFFWHIRRGGGYQIILQFFGRHEILALLIFARSHVQLRGFLCVCNIIFCAILNSFIPQTDADILC